MQLKVDSKPQMFTTLAHYYASESNSNSILQFIALSIRVLLFKLLVIAGDVEQNPGPLTDEGEYIHSKNDNVTLTKTFVTVRPCKLYSHMLQILSLQPFLAVVWAT